MGTSPKPYRLLLVEPFHKEPYEPALDPGTWQIDKEVRLRYYEELNLRGLLRDVEWGVHPGPLRPTEDGTVENREDFTLLHAAAMPIVKEECASGRWDALVLLGGGDPGSFAAKEIGKRYGVPVTHCASAQMHIACMLGNKFSVIDSADCHSMNYYNIILQQQMQSRCASIRTLDYPLARPGHEGGATLLDEKEKALQGVPSKGVEAAVDAATSAIEEDSAEVIIFGCSVTYWLQRFVRDGLLERGWDVPVIEGYSCAIMQAKLLVGLCLDASGLWLPPNRPTRLRHKKLL